MPAAPPPDHVARAVLPPGTVEWLQRYEVQRLVGPIPDRWEGQAHEGEHGSLTRIRSSTPKLEFSPPVADYRDRPPPHQSLPRSIRRRVLRYRRGTIESISMYSSRAW